MNKQQLASKIWESANKMRSKIEANEYKDYILGFIFYKFLSETEIARLKARDFAEEDLPSLVEDDEERGCGQFPGPPRRIQASCGTPSGSATRGTSLSAPHDSTRGRPPASP